MRQNRVRSTHPLIAGHQRSLFQTSACHPGTPKAVGGVVEQGRCEHARFSESCGVALREKRHFHGNSSALLRWCQHRQRDVAAPMPKCWLGRCPCSQIIHSASAAIAQLGESQVGDLKVPNSTLGLGNCASVLPLGNSLGYRASGPYCVV